MGITVKQMMKYLSGYPDDAGIGTMVVDKKTETGLICFRTQFWYWMSEKRAIWMPLKKQWHVNAKSRRY